MPTLRAVPIVIALVAALANARGQASDAQAVLRQNAEPVLAVELASGRQFTGVLDAASSAEQLVLRSAAEGITIRRPIRWERVARATLDGQPIEVSTLRALAAERHLPQPPDAQVVEIRLGPAAAPEELPAAEEVVPVAALRRAASVTFDSRVTHWSPGVETSGLSLDLAPLDHAGYVVPVSGTVMVELFAPQRRAFHHAPLSGGDTLELVERWHRAINAADFGPYGVRLRLPFGAIHPELDSHWLASPYGLVHVRLAAPGHGTFEHSIDGIRLRPWAPNRDRLELGTGFRYLPTEGLGRPDRHAGDR